MAKGSGMLAGMTRKNPPQQAKGDPKMPTASVNSDAVRSSTAASPKTLGGRTA